MWWIGGSAQVAVVGGSGTVLAALAHGLPVVGMPPSDEVGTAARDIADEIAAMPSTVASLGTYRRSAVQP